jgi:hypothetical protein
VVVALAWIACIDPPLNGQKGLRPNTTLYYSFVGSWPSDLKSCVEQGISKWNSAWGANGSGTHFSPVPASQPPNVTFVRTLIGGTSAAATTARTRDSQGYGVGFGTQFTTNTNLLSSCTGYLKATLHELGHASGLNDASGSGGSSVMNQFGGKDDGGGKLPVDVTACDKNRARVATPNPPAPLPPIEFCSLYSGSCQPCGRPSDIVDGFGCCHPSSSSPIIIDVSGGGVRLSSPTDGVPFDINADGVLRRVSWPWLNGGAWLVLDRNGNGTIDDGSELFGDHTPYGDAVAPDGYTALSLFDVNQSGAITAVDPVYGYLRLWSDANRDGVSQPGELTSLASARVRSISLTTRLAARVDEWGNLYRFRADVSFVNRPRVRDSFDVFLIITQ